MKYIVCLIIGVFFGCWITSSLIDKKVRIEAKKQFYITEAGKKEKFHEEMDSLKMDRILSQTEKEKNITIDLLELSSKYKEYTSESMAKQVILILSKYN